MIEALEIEIERAWLKLAGRPRGIALALTSTGKIEPVAGARRRAKWTELGVFDCRVTLRDFRDAVFHAWQEFRR